MKKERMEMVIGKVKAALDNVLERNSELHAVLENLASKIFINGQPNWEKLDVKVDDDLHMRLVVHDGFAELVPTITVSVWYPEEADFSMTSSPVPLEINKDEISEIISIKFWDTILDAVIKIILVEHQNNYAVQSTLDNCIQVFQAMLDELQLPYIVKLERTDLNGNGKCCGTCKNCN